MNLDSVRSEICDWLAAVLDCTTSWADPAAPAGTLPYARLQLRRVDREGIDELRAEGGLDEVRVVGTRLLTVRVSVFGADAMDRLVSAQSATGIPSFRSALGGGLSPAGDGGVLFDDASQGAILELRFRMPFEAIDRPGEITRALVEVEVRRPDGSPGLTDSIEFSR